MKPWIVRCLGLLVLGLTHPIHSTAQTHDAAGFEFALVGDYPYTPRDEVGMPYLLDDLKRETSLAFVLHLGDLHTPRRTDCSEALYRERRGWFVDLGIPFLFTPGDNDWADCQDEPLAFLQTLRRVFFSDPTHADESGGFALRRQSSDGEFPELVENAIWQRGGVVFATLHMIGPDLIPIPDGTAATRERLVAGAEVWLDEAFRVARESRARGVFLATQVSLWQVSGGARMLDLLDPGLIDIDPLFRDFEAQLIRHVREFRGPVVLANGDTHTFRIDKPLHDENLETIQTFTRVEGFGSPDGHWVRIRIDPARPEVFTFQQELVAANLYTLTPREQRLDDYESDELGRLKIVLRIFQAIPKLLAIVGAVALLRWGVLGLRLRRERASIASGPRA